MDDIEVSCNYVDYNFLRIAGYSGIIGYSGPIIFIPTKKIRKIFLYKKMKNNCRNLIPVYFSPDFTGGKLAKKDLSNFFVKLISV